MVEPPGGSPLRRQPAFPFSARGRRASPWISRSAPTRHVARRLAEDADVLIESWRPGVAERLGLGYESLARGEPATGVRIGHGFRPHRSPRPRPRLRGGGHGQDRRLRSAPPDLGGSTLVRGHSGGQRSAPPRRCSTGCWPPSTSESRQDSGSGWTPRWCRLRAVTTAGTGSPGWSPPATRMPSPPSHVSISVGRSPTGPCRSDCWWPCPRTVGGCNSRRRRSVYGSPSWRAWAWAGCWRTRSGRMCRRAPTSTGARPCGSGCSRRPAPGPSTSGGRSSKRTRTCSPRCSARGPSFFTTHSLSMTSRSSRWTTPNSERSDSSVRW